MVDDCTAESSGYESLSRCSCSCYASSSGTEYSSDNDDVSSSSTARPAERRHVRGRRKRGAAHAVAGKAPSGRHTSSPARYTQPSLGLVQFMDNGHPGQPVHITGTYPAAPQPPHLMRPGGAGPVKAVSGGLQTGFYPPPPPQQPPFPFPTSYPDALPPQKPPNVVELKPAPPAQPPLWHVPPKAGTQDSQYCQQPQSISSSSPSWMLLEAQLRAASLHDIVHRKLLPKRKELLQQVEAIDARSDEVRAACKQAAARVRNSADQQLQRLSALEASKLTALKQQSDTLKSHVEEIRHILCETSVAVGPDSMHAGLQLPKLNAIEDSASALAEKTFNSEVATSADGFEEMVQNYDELMERHCSLAKLLCVKDQMIWKLLDERTRLRREIEEIKSHPAGPSEMEGPPITQTDPLARGAGEAAAVMDQAFDSVHSFDASVATDGGNTTAVQDPGEVLKTSVEDRQGKSQHRSDCFWVHEAVRQAQRSIASGSSASRSSVPPRVSSGTEGYLTDVEERGGVSHPSGLNSWHHRVDHS